MVQLESSVSDGWGWVNWVTIVNHYNGQWKDGLMDGMEWPSELVVLLLELAVHQFVNNLTAKSYCTFPMWEKVKLISCIKFLIESIAVIRDSGV